MEGDNLYVYTNNETNILTLMLTTNKLLGNQDEILQANARLWKYLREKW